ncbi:hypothetical protein G6F23_014451 [Rhizopus arrhizus]|nr:hypothetical protein G6F23_014451 [Rhizopus arrhizus]
MRHHLLRVDHDRRERRGQHEADQHCQHRRPEQIRMRQHQRERRHTQDRRPDDRLATDAVTQRAAEETTGGRGHQEREQVQLRLCHRNAEVVDQVEGEVAADAGHVSSAMPIRAAPANHEAACWPYGTITAAAISGPSAVPKLPPTWNTDCAKP